MLRLLNVPVPDPDSAPAPHLMAAMAAPATPAAPTKGDLETGSSPAGIRSARTGSGSARTGRASARSPPKSPHYMTASPSARIAAAIAGGGNGAQSARPLTGNAKMKFHFFSFQIHGTTGFMGHS